MPLFYPAQLDTVRFASDVDETVRAQRALRAEGDIFLRLLDQRYTPVFSASQMFDRAAVLDLVSEPSADAEKFLKLVEEGIIQMRISPSLVEPRATERDTFSLANAFATAAKGGFRFSTWPELADDGAAREHAAAVALGKTKDMLHGRLGKRLYGLHLLDLAFRKSIVLERATEPPWLLEECVRSRVTSQSHLAYLAQLLVDLLRTNGGLTRPHDLSKRTGWYNLLKQYAELEQMPAKHGQLEAIRREVDLQYNIIVARSLGATVMRLDDDTEDHLVVTEKDALVSRFRKEASVLLGTEARAAWFSWAQLYDCLGSVQFRSSLIDDTQRERRFREVVKAGALHRLDESRYMLLIKVAFAGFGAVSSAAAVQLATQQAVPSGAGALLGALFGSVASTAIEDLNIQERLRQRQLDRHIRNIEYSASADIAVKHNPNAD